MARSSGFGSVTYDLMPLSGSLSLWLQYSLTLTLPQATSRQLILQQARSRALSRSSTACKLTISCSFHSPPGVLFTFPSRYLFTIGCLVIFSLTRWSSQIQKGFHVSLPTWDTALNDNAFNYRAFTFYDVAFQLLHLTYTVKLCCPTTLYL